MPIRLIRVLWPSFLMSIVACGLFFSAFDPIDLAMLRGFIDLQPITVYSLGFIGFWVIGAISSWLTLLLSIPDGDESAPGEQLSIKSTDLS